MVGAAFCGICHEQRGEMVGRPIRRGGDPIERCLIPCCTQQDPGSRLTRELIGSVDADLDDATGRADLLDPDDYRASQVFGSERRAAGSNGITWSSVRYPGGQCIAVFWPDVIPIPTQGGHFAYHWNGTTVDFVKRMETGEVMAVI